MDHYERDAWDSTCYRFDNSRFIRGRRQLVNYIKCNLPELPYDENIHECSDEWILEHGKNLETLDTKKIIDFSIYFMSMYDYLLGDERDFFAVLKKKIHSNLCKGYGGKKNKFSQFYHTYCDDINNLDTNFLKGMVIYETDNKEEIEVKRKKLEEVLIKAKLCVYYREKIVPVCKPKLDQGGHEYYKQLMINIRDRLNAIENLNDRMLYHTYYGNNFPSYKDAFVKIGFTSKRMLGGLEDELRKDLYELSKIERLRVLYVMKCIKEKYGDRTDCKDMGTIVKKCHENLGYDKTRYKWSQPVEYVCLYMNANGQEVIDKAIKNLEKVQIEYVDDGIGMFDDLEIEDVLNEKK